MKHTRNGVSIIEVAFAAVKPNQELPNPESYGKSIIQLSNDLAGIKQSSKSTKRSNSNPKIFTKSDFSFDKIECFKFIPTDILNNRIKKGWFRLGTLEGYRNAENVRIKDVQEGFTTLLISTKDRQIYSSLMAGFNYYVFCATEISSKDGSGQMQQNFGESLIRIKSIKSFASAVAKAIGARRVLISRIQYTDSKLYQFEKKNYQVGNEIRTAFDDLYDDILQNLPLPSLFLKPSFFKPENEVRLAFEMPKDVKRNLDLNNLGLLRQIEIYR